MQTQDDHAPMIDAIRFRTILLQVSRHELVLFQAFPFMAELMLNHQQQPQ
jgi:hypothetical protein